MYTATAGTIINVNRDITGILSLINRSEQNAHPGTAPVDRLLEAAEKMIDYMDLMGPMNNVSTPVRMS